MRNNFHHFSDRSLAVRLLQGVGWTKLKGMNYSETKKKELLARSGNDAFVHDLFVHSPLEKFACGMSHRRRSHPSGHAPMTLVCELILQACPEKGPACVASRRKLTGEWKWDPNFPNDEEEVCKICACSGSNVNPRHRAWANESFRRTSKDLCGVVTSGSIREDLG